MSGSGLRWKSGIMNEGIMARMTVGHIGLRPMRAGGLVACHTRPGGKLPSILDIDHRAFAA